MHRRFGVRIPSQQNQHRRGSPRPYTSFRQVAPGYSADDSHADKRIEVHALATCRMRALSSEISFVSAVRWQKANNAMPPREHKERTSGASRTKYTYFPGKPNRAATNTTRTRCVSICPTCALCQLKNAARSDRCSALTAHRSLPREVLFARNARLLRYTVYARPL